MNDKSIKIYTHVEVQRHGYCYPVAAISNRPFAGVHDPVTVRSLALPCLLEPSFRLPDKHSGLREHTTDQGGYAMGCKLGLGPMADHTTEEASEANCCPAKMAITA